MTQDIEKRIDNLLDETQKLIKAQEEKRARFYEALGMTEEELHEMMETQDEVIDLDASIDMKYYVLSEEEATRDIRVEMPELKKYIPMEKIRKNQINYRDKAELYVQTPEGEYYPDYIEEKGIHLFSVKFHEYIKNKIFMENIERNGIVLVSEEGKRHEEYRLLIPRTIDCVLKGSEKYDKIGNLIYFEIDPVKVGKCEMFKVKDFPHIIIANKLNRIKYSGFKCLRIENHFEYEKEQEKQYKRRKSGEELNEILKTLAKEEKREIDSDKYLKIKKVYESESIRKQIREGFESIYESYSGDGYGTKYSLNERFIMFFWSKKSKMIYISEEESEDYGINSIELPEYTKIEEIIDKMPENVKELAEKASYECLMNILIEESKIFRKYKNIHKNARMKIYIKEEMSLSMVPDIICDYKTEKQEKIESLTDYSKIEFKDMDLSSYDLSGKDLSGKKFENCNMNRIKLSKSKLDGCEIVKCNLTGAEFIGSSMKKIKMKENDVDRVKFVGADLSESVHEDNRPENHADYTKANLTGAIIINERLHYNCFIKAKLKDAKLNIKKRTLACLFIGADMRNIVVEGEKKSFDCGISECNLSNTNINNGTFILYRLTNNNFTKSKLDMMNLEDIRIIRECNFRCSSLWGTSFGEKELVENDFTFVNLSNIKEKKNIEFSDNDLSYTNLSGFDFVETKYMFANKLVYTDMSNCKFRFADFTDSEVMFPNFKGSKLNDACFLRSQLEYVNLSGLQKDVIDIEEDEDE